MASPADRLFANNLFLVHTVISAATGLAGFAAPHRFVAAALGDDSHVAHEFLRMWASLQLSLAWLALSMRKVNDGRCRRVLAECFAVGYTLQALALVRAIVVVPHAHSAAGALTCGLYAALGASYGYLRWFRTIKVFSLDDER